MLGSEIMGFLRKRSSGQYAYGFRWDGQQYIKALKTDNDHKARQIKKDAAWDGTEYLNGLRISIAREAGRRLLTSYLPPEAAGLQSGTAAANG